MLRLSEDVLRTGAVWLGTRGSGKTLGLSRATAVPLFMGGSTVAVLDVAGTLTNDILWCLTRNDPNQYPTLWDTVFYVPLGGYAGHVMSTPFLASLTPGDTLERRAMRPVNLWIRLSPDLERAPMLGAAKLRTVGRDVLMLAAAMGLELVDVEDLLLQPSRYTERVKTALAQHPHDLAGPVRWFELYPKMSKTDKSKETDALLARVTPYPRSEKLAAQFGGSSWDVPLSRMRDRKQLLILIDGRGLPGDEERRLGIAWMFQQIVELVSTFEPSRDRPVFLVIDELAVLVGNDNKAMEEQFNQLVQFGRNYSCGVIAAYQEEGQLSRRMTESILPQLGCQFYSSTIDPASAERRSKRFDNYDPHAVKDYRTNVVSTWGQIERLPGDPVYYSLQEQTELNKHQYMDLEPLQFLAAIASAEGKPATSTQRIDLRPFARHQGWPDREVVERVRGILIRNHGQRIEDVLSEIWKRRAGPESDTTFYSERPRPPR